MRGGAARASLAQMEAVFNNGGNRRIVEARMSVAEADGLAKALEKKVEKQRDAATTNKGTGLKETYDQLDDDDDERGAFDYDLSRLGPEGQMMQQQGRRGGAGKRVALFGRSEALRGAWEALEDLEAQNRRARDRFSGARLVQRYGVEAPLFPLLDSYPRVFTCGKKEGGMAVRTSLETSSRVSERLRAMGGLVGRLVGVDQREELANGLKTLAEEYEEGWDSGLEDSEDDDE